MSPLRDDPIFFAVKSIRLHTGIPKNVSVFVNLEKVKDGEVILFESNNSEIQVEPDSESCSEPKKGKKSKNSG